MSDAFYKSSFFLNYSALLSDGDQMQWLLVNCFCVRLSCTAHHCISRIFY